MHSVTNTTRILGEVSLGRPGAAEQFLPIVYDELRRLAAAYFARQNNSHTLQPTALVHEAYLKLVDQTASTLNDRAHFFRLAARAMRQILIDHARASRTAKRGGGKVPHALSAEPAQVNSFDRLDWLALDEAITRLATLDERQAAVVELRFFGGMSVEETAASLGVSPRTVELDWRVARAWLNKTLSDHADEIGR